MTASQPSPRDTLLRMTNAFQMSQAIHAAVTLGIADFLEERPRSADELAEATGADAPTLYRLLRALASVGVFAEQADGRFGLTPLVECLRPGNDSDPAKLMDLNMLVMLGGRERTADDFERPYAGAGFGLVNIVRTGSPFRIIEGAPV